MKALLILSLLVGAAVHADTLELLGWSADGSTVAVLEHGVSDGSGFPWAKLTLIDAVKRRSIGEPIKLSLEKEGATEAEVIALAKKKADAERKKLKIEAWVAGKQIEHDDKGELREKAGAPIGTVELSSAKANKKQQARPCEEPFVAQRLKLVLHWMDDETPFVLLDEKKTPKERACVTSCKLGPVFGQKTSGLFILECEVQGFEGPGKLWFPVAAKLPYGLDQDLPQ